MNSRKNQAEVYLAISLGLFGIWIRQRGNRESIIEQFVFEVRLFSECSVAKRGGNAISFYGLPSSLLD